MNEQIRISGKNLGALALPKFCPRCFWLKLRLGNNLPFQIFPGIFSSIDAYTKRVIHGWLDDLKSPPVWLASLGAIETYVDPPHHSKFQLINAEFNIKLTGSCDAIFKMADGTYTIADYKTAKFTENQDSLLPVYVTQLNSYALIAEAVGIAPISGLALIYFDPVTDDTAACAERHRLENGLGMSFSAHVKKITLDPSSIKPLLAEARRIFDLESPPIGRIGCTDCNGVDQMKKLMS